MHLYDSVSVIPGVGKTTKEKLEKLGISTVYDLIRFFPRAYEPRGLIKPLSSYTTEYPSAYMLTIASEVHSVKLKGNITVSKFRAFDDSGSIEVVYFNSPFVKDVFHIGASFRFYGKVQVNKSRPQLISPKYEPYIEGVALPDFVPIYPLTAGISSKQLDKLTRVALGEVLSELADPLPEKIRLKEALPTLTYAIKNIHSPTSEEALTKSLERMAFDEMLTFGLGISMSKAERKRGDGIRLAPCSLEPFTRTLPYELTGSQKQAINDIYRDTVIGQGGVISPMARIIVGDVGCGKTVCAAAAVYLAAKSGYQSAVMVPTEILARQHYRELGELLGGLGIKVGLLVGAMTVKEKRLVRESLANGEIHVLVGTHALISDKTEFSNLGLIVTDEQHRFGVAQRATLKERCSSAHLLVMSATPIPRTLALTMYGDLDISRITEMPAGRQRVDTYLVGEDYRQRLNDFIKKQAAIGGQCYVVCPSIEGEDDEVVAEKIGSMVSSRDLNLKSAIEYTEELKRALPELKIEALHGKMKSAEKDEIMLRFSAGEIQVLVSTTVIEVGVNVPSATLMIVENADRFGLSQLHQLRGRVGRGRMKSYCVLVSDTSRQKSRARLEVMRTTYDGYIIAENDLLLRGPGDFFSSSSGDNMRQSGGFEFKFASMSQSSDLFERAFSTAKSIIESDPELVLEEHLLLKKSVQMKLSINSSTVS